MNPTIPVQTLVPVLATGIVLLAALATAALRPAWVVRAPRVVLASTLTASIIAALCVVQPWPPALRIAVDPSSGPLLRRGDPGLPAYERAVLDFGSDDIYVVVMETDGLFTAPRLATLQRVTNAIRRLEGVREAESLLNTISFRYDPDQDWVEVRPFIEEIPTDPQALASLRERALADPIYAKTLVSRDGRSGAINVTFQPLSDAEFVGLDLDGRIRSILDAEAHTGVRFYVAGRPHVRAQAHHIMVRDLVRLIPLAILVASIALWLMTGAWRSVLLPVTSCLLATLWTFGLMAVVGVDLNLVTLVLGPMLICVGSVYGVHVVARYDSEAPRAADAAEAAFSCLSSVRLPVLIAGGTTCAGFAALTLADVHATYQLGWFSVFGIVCVTLLSLTALPATLALLPLPARSSNSNAPSRPRPAVAFDRTVDALLVRTTSWTKARPGLLILGWACAAAAALAAIPRIHVDTDFLSFFDRRSSVRTDFAAVNRLLAGAVPLYVPFFGTQEGTFRDPERLRELARVQRELETLLGVSQVLSMVDLVQVANRALQGGRPEALRVPDSRAAVAETIFLIPKDRLRRYANSNHSSANLVVRTGELGSAAIRELEGRIRTVLDGAGLPPGVETTVTGKTLLVNRSADGIAGNQLGTVGAATVAVLILVSVVFRSLRLALLAMIPNIVPVVLFFGALGAGAAALSIPTSLIGCIALGIAVDDTVHLLAAYQRARNSGLAADAATRESLRRVGRPIVVTSVMLCVGFAVITTSGFATLREFGTLTALTMALCLATDLLLTPALLVRFRP